MSNSLIDTVPVDGVALLGVKSSAGLAMTKIVQLFGHELLMLFDTNSFSIEGIFFLLLFILKKFVPTVICTVNEQRASHKDNNDDFWWHDDIIKWKHFLHYWPLVRGIHL